MYKISNRTAQPIAIANTIIKGYKSLTITEDDFKTYKSEIIKQSRANRISYFNMGDIKANNPYTVPPVATSGFIGVLPTPEALNLKEETIGEWQETSTIATPEEIAPKPKRTRKPPVKKVKDTAPVTEEVVETPKRNPRRKKAKA